MIFGGVFNIRIKLAECNIKGKLIKRKLSNADDAELIIKRDQRDIVSYIHSDRFYAIFRDTYSTCFAIDELDVKAIKRYNKPNP